MTITSWPRLDAGVVAEQRLDRVAGREIELLEGAANPKPWIQAKEHRHLQRILRQLAAERFGCDSAIESAINGRSPRRGDARCRGVESASVIEWPTVEAGGDAGERLIDPPARSQERGSTEQDVIFSQTYKSKNTNCRKTAHDIKQSKRKIELK